MAYKPRKRKVKKNIPEGQVHIKATYNNTVVTVTDKDGNALCWGTPGALGIKGSKKSTAYAATLAASSAAKKAVDMGMKVVDVYVKGLGAGREAAIRALAPEGLEVRIIKDDTPIPHNGCRPPKKRRG